MDKPTCIIDDCIGAVRARGFCNKHYIRQRLYGDPLTFHPDATRGCSVTDCTGDHHGHGWCQLHYQRWSKTGDPLELSPHFSPLAGKSGDAHPLWQGDDAGYYAIHGRLSKDPAMNHVCAHCLGRAEQWAYDHEDPDEHVSGAGFAYSTKGRRHYIPLCCSCHRRFDAAHSPAPLPTQEVSP